MTRTILVPLADQKDINTITNYSVKVFYFGPENFFDCYKASTFRQKLKNVYMDNTFVRLSDICRGNFLPLSHIVSE
jgi:hypothetical protein